MIQSVSKFGADFHHCSSKLFERMDLSFEEAYALMSSIMDGRLSPVQISSVLSSLRLKGETPEEIAGFSQAMLDKANRIEYEKGKPLIDIVGTGGAPFKTFNVSTTTAILMPTLGVAVAKHGNRSSTSKSGSADLLEALGINIEMDPKTSENCLNQIDLTFMFAPKFHPAMKQVVPVRKELGFRTIFNLLGPLTNPCGVNRQLTGVYDVKLLKPIAESLKERGYRRVALVHSNLGADEITNVGSTIVVELNEDKIISHTVSASSFGIKEGKPDSIRNMEPNKSAKECVRILLGYPSEKRNFVVVNGAMALKIAGIVEDLKEAAIMVQDALDSTSAINTLEKFVRLSGGVEEKLDEIFESISRS